MYYLWSFTAELIFFMVCQHFKPSFGKIKTHMKKEIILNFSHTTPLTESSWSPRLSPPCLSATPPGMIREIYIGEFCSFPPITLKPRPSSVFGSSTTRGCEWPSLAAKAATVAWKKRQLFGHVMRSPLSPVVCFAERIRSYENILKCYQRFESTLQTLSLKSLL